MRHHFYGISLSVLGLWELASFASRGRIPTVTTTVRRSRVRQVTILLWIAGAIIHVTRGAR